MEELKCIQSDVLVALKADFEENNVPVVLRNAGENGIPVDILTTLHRNFGRNMDEVMGEFYFLPLRTGEKPVLYFSALISLTDSLPPEHADTVAKALEVLNFYLECGSFVLDRQTRLLAYKLVTPVFAHWGKEQILEAANMNVGHALQISERYTDSLLMLADGRESLEHFMELMPNV